MNETLSDISNEELDLLDTLVNEAFSSLGLSDLDYPDAGSRLNRAGWLVNLKKRFLTIRHRRRLAGDYPIF